VADQMLGSLSEAVTPSVQLSTDLAKLWRHVLRE
jgi:hypothetical protein